MSDTQYEEHTYTSLKAGQVVLIGTDGIWEMPNMAGDEFGKDRLRDAIRASAAGDAADVVKAVLDSVGRFRGDCRPVDDLTFVIIKKLAVSAEL
jgi:sigma-B regulation protein RsbU (phosphoserine phosphatase)